MDPGHETSYETWQSFIDTQLGRWLAADARLTDARDRRNGWINFADPQTDRNRSGERITPPDDGARETSVTYPTSPDFEDFWFTWHFGYNAFALAPGMQLKSVVITLRWEGYSLELLLS
ncbi:unnamed protein product [Amoebophrya sp. A120]|nr:unnamed protein product [Amoebophrya sp. A120]|eukprot:GSA120T00012525001.1